ncbi:unnamed protein product [Sphenostylis stenocarpa]|uniref:Uncharacterized protein n=1 Tax=Sphenostylis stenocarpa TaxID=92480 RepID=A0AA86SSP5_9FABA|nr:unnamed protein product [Sphenostylis stenocarpa]
MTDRNFLNDDCMSCICTHIYAHTALSEGWHVTLFKWVQSLIPSSVPCCIKQQSMTSNHGPPPPLSVEYFFCNFYKS